ncbi:MAG: hypothetical protein WBE28_07425, partial [bacterium]
MIRHQTSTLSIMLFCMLLAGVFPPAKLSAQEDITADQILETLTETMNPEQSQGIMTMTIVT